MRQEDTQQSFQEPNINDGLEAADSSAAPINLNEEIVDSEIESTPDPQTVPETKPPSAAELDPQPTTKPVPEPVVEPTPNNPVSPQNKPSPEVGHVQIVSESDPFSELPPYEGPPIPQAELSKTIENVNPPLNQALPKMQSENELAAPETNAAEAVPNDQTNESPQPTTPTEQPTNEQSPATDPPAPLPDAKVETNPSPIRPDGEISDIKLTTSTPSPSNDAVTQTSWQPNEIQLLVIFFLVLLLIAIAIWNFRKINDFVSKFFLKEKVLKPSSAWNPGWIGSSNSGLKVEESFAAGAPTTSSQIKEASSSIAFAPKPADTKTTKLGTKDRPGGGHRSFKPPPSSKQTEPKAKSAFFLSDDGIEKIKELESLVNILEEEKATLNRDKIKLSARFEHVMREKLEAESLAKKVAAEYENKIQSMTSPSAANGTDDSTVQELAAAKAEIEQLRSSVNALNAQIDNPILETSAATRTKGNVVEAKSELLVRLNDAQQKKEIAEHELHLAISEAKSFKQKLRELEKSHSKLSKETRPSSEFEELDTELSQLKESFAKQEMQLEQQEKALAQQQTQLTQKDDELAQRAKELARQADQNAAREREAQEGTNTDQIEQELSEQLAQRKEELAKQSTQLNQQTEALDQLRQQLADKEEELSQQLSQHDEALTKRSTLLAQQGAKLSQRNGELEKQLTEREEELAAQAKELDKRLLASNELTKERDSIKFDLFQSKTQLEKANDELASKESKIEDAKQKVAGLKTDLENLKDQKTRASKEATEFTKSSGEFKTKVASLEKELSQSSKERNAALEKIVQFETLIAEREETLSQLQSKSKQTDESAKELEQQLTKKDQQIAQLKQSLGSTESELAETSKQLERELADQKKQVAEQLALISEQNTKLHSSQLEINQINETCDQLKQTIANQKTEHETTLAENSQSTSGLKESQQRIKALEADLKNFTDRNSEISDLLIEERETQARLKETIAKQDSKIGSHTKEFASLRQQLAQLEQMSEDKLTAKDAAMAKLDQEVERLKRLQSEKGPAENESQELVKRLKKIAKEKTYDLQELQRISEVNEANYGKLVHKAKGYKSELLKSLKRNKKLATERAELKQMVEKHRATVESLQQQSQKASSNGSGNGASPPPSAKELDAAARKLAREHVLTLKSSFEEKVKKKNELIRQLRNQLRMIDESNFDSES
jgi:chromosome segregation ATPase